ALAAAAEVTQICDRPVALHASEQTARQAWLSGPRFLYRVARCGQCRGARRAAEPEAAGAVGDDRFYVVAVRELREHEGMLDAIFLSVKRRCEREQEKKTGRDHNPAKASHRRFILQRFAARHAAGRVASATRVRRFRRQAAAWYATTLTSAVWAIARSPRG